MANKYKRGDKLMYIGPNPQWRAMDELYVSCTRRNGYYIKYSWREYDARARDFVKRTNSLHFNYDHFMAKDFILDTPASRVLYGVKNDI